jgi:hypothetical protein
MTTSKSRQARAKAAAEGRLDGESFLDVATRFIELANRINQRVNATQLHKAFLWAAARYNAHVAKSVLDLQDREGFVKEMTRTYEEMLRQHMADPTLKPPTKP